MAADYAGVGVASKDVDGVSVLGGIIRGYRLGMRLEATLRDVNQRVGFVAPTQSS